MKKMLEKKIIKKKIVKLKKMKKKKSENFSFFSIKHKSNNVK